MPSDAVDIEARSDPKGGQKIRLRSLDDLDRRTSAARRVFELRDLLIDDLGGQGSLSVMQRQLIDNVALLGAMIQDCAASYLQGRPIDLTEFQSLANAQRRLMADLGLERKMKDVTPSMRDSLIGKRA